MAAWLALVAAARSALHRFYLHGWRDRLGWAVPAAHAARACSGVQRMRALGQDDTPGLRC
ncbi:MAG: hypothetical protein MZW92_71165 [Comamonadaceae bacterium]|nr:hypothetical protein [Comamonadaceae bacterium]